MSARLRLALQQEAQYRLRQKVVKALRYPCFVLAIAMLVSLLMLTLVLPEFSNLYASFDTPLPWFTRQLLHLADGIARYGLAGFVIALSALLGYCSLRRRSLLAGEGTGLAVEITAPGAFDPRRLPGPDI